MKIRRPRWPTLVLLVVLPGTAWLAVYRWSTPGDDVLRPTGTPRFAHLEWTGTPLFIFGDPYLDGRSAWLRERFERDRARLAALSAPPEPTIEVEVHREPFTRGEWVARLDETQRSRRQEIEAQTVESEIVCFFPDLGVKALAIAISCSGAISKIPNEGGIEWTAFYPPIEEPPPPLSELPQLDRHQYLTREIFRQEGRLFARPTDVFLLNDLRREGSHVRRIYQAWRNVGDEHHGRVHLAAGQFALDRRDGGTLLHVRSYFSGQHIPAFAEPIVRAVTRRFYLKLLRWYRENAARWSPPPRARVWIESLDWE